MDCQPLEVLVLWPTFWPWLWPHSPSFTNRFESHQNMNHQLIPSSLFSLLGFVVANKVFGLSLYSKVCLANKPPNLKILPRVKIFHTMRTASSKVKASILLFKIIDFLALTIKPVQIRTFVSWVTKFFGYKVAIVSVRPKLN